MSILKTMIQRGSIRAYQTNNSIPKSDLDLIIQATQQSPTSINGQQYSIITVTNPEKRKKMIELTMPSSGNPQQYIADCDTFLVFIIDYHKSYIAGQIENTPIEYTQGIDSLLTGCIDAGIAVGTATAAAEALGYGTVTIGALRKFTAQVIEVLELPKYTYPVVGLCIGIPNAEVQITPRLPLETFLHYNTYNKQDLTEIFKDYNKTLTSTGHPAWTEFVTLFYGKQFFTDQVKTYKKQGFDLQ